MTKNKNRISGWRNVKASWFKRYKPDKNGNYECGICHQPVAKKNVSLDQIATVEEYPEYAKELSNLRPTHEWCNQERSAGQLKLLRKRNVLGISKYRRK